jgi:heat shock protein HslJ
VRIASLVLLAAAAVVAVACSTAGAPAPSPAGLDGRTFLATTVVGHDLVAGSRVRLTFKDGQLGMSAGCNRIGGAFELVGGRLATGDLAMTDMGCAAALMAQDTWLSGFVSGATVELDGPTLTLRNRDVTMNLTDREVADPDRPLEGTRWVVDGIVSGDAISSIPAGVTAALTITDGQLQVETGCNRGQATVAVAGATLTVGPLALTKMVCGPDATAVERAIVAVLAGQVGYQIEADVLRLAAGRQGLTLRAAS